MTTALVELHMGKNVYLLREVAVCMHFFQAAVWLGTETIVAGA